MSDQETWDEARALYYVWLGSISPDAWTNMSAQNRDRWFMLTKHVQSLPPQQPIAMRLLCEGCGELHLDEGDFATKPHKVHACQKCGMVWKPADVPTVGVQFLPGHKNATT